MGSLHAGEDWDGRKGLDGSEGILQDSRVRNRLIETYQSSSTVDTGTPSRCAVHPFWPSEFPETIFRHLDGLCFNLLLSLPARLLGRR